MDEPRQGPEHKPQVMTVQELANYLRLSQAKVYRMAKERSLPAFRVGRSWRFRKDLIDTWIEGKSGFPSSLGAAAPEGNEFPTARSGSIV
jgi:excisionase family DNA binding protein